MELYTIRWIMNRFIVNRQQFKKFEIHFLRLIISMRNKLMLTNNLLLTNRKFQKYFSAFKNVIINPMLKALKKLKKSF